MDKATEELGISGEMDAQEESEYPIPSDNLVYPTLPDQLVRSRRQPHLLTTSQESRGRHETVGRVDQGDSRKVAPASYGQGQGQGPVW